MKSTIKISISGIAFDMDNDAYGCLKNYLDRMENIFSGKEGGREIIEDIEVRIAELLSARIQSPAQIITLATVNEVIHTVGSADDIAGGEEGTAAFVPEQFKVPEPERKRLFRDIDHRVIGGVCSGLGNYFGIDRVFVRLAFAIALVFFPFHHRLFHINHSFPGTIASFALLLYIILWIVMPAARTMKEKMTMRKEPISPASQQKSETAAARASHESDFGRVLGKIITVVCRIIAGFVLAVMAFAALSLLIALPVGLIGGNMVLGESGVLDIADNLRAYTAIPMWLVVTLLTLLVCVPLIGLIYIISKVLFKFKTKIRMGLILSIVWLAAFFSTMGIGIYVVSEYRNFPLGLHSGGAEKVSEERSFGPFKELGIAGNFEVTAMLSDSNRMVIEAPENVMPHIQTETGGGKLEIYTKLYHRRQERSYIRFYCTDWRLLEKLRLRGAVRFTCADTLRAGAFSATLSGTSGASLAVHNGQTKFDISGASRAEVAGETGTLEVDMSGASRITAGMVAERVRIDLSGAGNIVLSGKASYADFRAAGASKINAGGFAADSVTLRLSGSSRIG
ncbi:MAG: DUF2807 domain-containing protein, partial [Prevotellaceae bacterium]|nr:DUF2807 domain-containing protein [Prevotellaceae bacterium]